MRIFYECDCVRLCVRVWGREDRRNTASARRRARVCVGHSMGGAAALLAERARPGVFSAIVAMEPIVSGGWGRKLLWGDTKPAHVAAVATRRCLRTSSSQISWFRVHGHAARNSRRGWRPQRACGRAGERVNAAVDRHYACVCVWSAFRYFRTKKFFDRWDPAAFDGYLRGGLVEVAAGDATGELELSCTPETEAGVFSGVNDAWEALPDLRVPCTVRGRVGGGAAQLVAVCTK